MPIVRRPSTRLSPVELTVGSMRTSSPSGTTPPVGVATGTAASASGLSQPLARRIMSRRRSPSKCSPTQMPSPSARTTVATFARVQPDEPQLRLRELEVLERPHLRARHLLRDDVLGLAGGLQEGVEIRGLQPHLDVAAVAEAAEEVPLLGEHVEVREARGDLLVHDLPE